MQLTESARNRRLGSAAAIVLASLGLIVPAAARPVADPATPKAVVARAIDDEPILVIAQRGAVSLAQARAMAEKRYPGRVLRAETKMTDERTVHEILIMDEQQKVRTVRIDAATGAFL